MDPVTGQPTTPTNESQEPEGFVYQRDHNKSFEIIAHEQMLEAREEAEKLEVTESELPEKTDPPVAEEVVIEKPLEVERPTEPQIDPVKLAQEVAQKALEDYKLEAKKIDESTLSEAEKVKEQEALKTRWTQENRTPRDYDEIVEESRRINREETLRLIDQREQARLAESQRQAEEQRQVEEIKSRQQAEYISSVEKMALDELQELREAGIMLTPKDPNDRNDPAVKEAEALFAKALEVNTDNIKNGKPPIISISRIFYNHYKPSIKPVQPPGADAPVSGPKTTPSERPQDSSKWTPEDSKKSFAQIMREIVSSKR